MASGARVVRIFVGGPDDTRSERQMVVDVLVNHLQKELGERFSLKPFTYDDRFLPVMMEAADPQASINEVCAVGEADLVIMLFKGSLGASRPPAGSTAPSASTWELEEAVRGGKALGVLVAQLASHNPQPVQSGSTVPEVQTAYLTMYEHWLRQEKLQADLQHYMLSHRDEFGRRCPSLRTVRMDANIADVIHRFVTEALAVPAADPAPEDTPGYFEGFPYCGLIEFTYDHRMAYFGRTEEVAEIVQRCSGPDPVPLLLVHGSSGVGKSSLLQAGVLREIERGGDPVQHLVFEPAGDTGRPFRQFATAFKNLVRARVRCSRPPDVATRTAPCRPPPRTSRRRSCRLSSGPARSSRSCRSSSTRWSSCSHWPTASASRSCASSPRRATSGASDCCARFARNT